MAGRGVHFALTSEDESKLMDETDADDEQTLSVIGEIEERWEQEWLCETDKAWDAIHRCLTDGQLEYGRDPLHQCILGKENLLEDEDYIVNFLNADEVEEVHAAIKGIDEVWLRQKYNAIDASDYDGVLSEEDFQYTLTNFMDLKRFFEKVAKNRRSVVFTVDL